MILIEYKSMVKPNTLTYPHTRTHTQSLWIITCLSPVARNNVNYLFALPRVMGERRKKMMLKSDFFIMISPVASAPQPD